MWVGLAPAVLLGWFNMVTVYSGFGIGVYVL